jgi:Zn-dependent protease with chaperone function
MRSARGLFWLQLGLGALGIAAAAFAAAVAARSVDPALPTPAGLRTMCAGMLSGESALGWMIILVLAGIGIAVPLRAAHSVLRQLQATRRFLRTLPVTHTEPGSPRLVIVRDDRLLAFCCGHLRPRIYLSTAAKELLDEAELHAVLAHERHHAYRRDPLRMLIAQGLRDAVFFIPVLGRCQLRFGALAELAADEKAVAEAGVRPLASALAAFDAHGGPMTAVSGERVDHLLGARHGWQVSPAALLGGLWSVAGVAALAMVGAALLGPQQATFVDLASAACGLLLIALPVLAVGLAAGALGTRRTVR